eukprot:scaffold72790_cov41-Prasinocladus_malaysianus.AAC.2
MAAPASSAPSAAPPPAQNPPVDHKTVGGRFVEQYYTVLHNSPKHLYRFFHEGSSSFSHQSAFGGQEAELLVGQPEEALKKCIEGLYVGDFTVSVEVTSVNTQPSAQGGVLVLVTGQLRVQFPDAAVPGKPFGQTFFLAPQPGGFFVLNDVLRYFPSAPAPPPPVPMGMPMPVPMPSHGPPTPPMMENGMPPPTAPSATAPPPPTTLPGWAQPQVAQPPPPVKAPPAPEAPPVPAPPEAPEEAADQEPAPKVHQ